MPSLVVQRFAAAVFRQGGEHDFLITDEGASTLTLHSVFVAAYANDPTEQGKFYTQAGKGVGAPWEKKGARDFFYTNTAGEVVKVRGNFPRNASLLRPSNVQDDAALRANLAGLELGAAEIERVRQLPVPTNSVELDV